jgi:hypothetical protein
MGWARGDGRMWEEEIMFQGDYLGMLYESHVWAFSERC